MRIIKIILLIFITISPLVIWSQIERGSLIADKKPISIEKYYSDSLIDINTIRQKSHFLTDADITTYNSDVIPKRKKAFMRHVKHINEKLEQEYIKGSQRTKEMDELIYEIHLLEESLKQKTSDKAKTKMSFSEQIKMMSNTFKAKSVLKYKIPDKFQNKNDSILRNPNISPYYHSPVSEIPLHKQFAHLANQKNIDVKENMVVLFKGLSFSGSAPKINTIDLDFDNEWNLKWGDEVHTDVVGSRIFASLGFDVDHPYFYRKNKLTLVFEDHSEVKDAQALTHQINGIYNVDITPFISNYGGITKEMADSISDLKAFIGHQYVRFYKCGLEARPDRVKRIGSFLPSEEINSQRRELKGALLAHLFIGNWDTREANTLLTTVHDGNYNYRISAVFSDLGASMGVKQKILPPDFKVGLVNEFSWEAISRKNNTIRIHDRINAILPSYENADYEDLLWMAMQIGQIDEYNLRKMVKKAHWPKPIEELYVHKLASRRASILKAFNITDPHPIPFNKKLSVIENGQSVVKEGVLLLDYNAKENPESFINKKGRLRNYGN